MAHMNKTAPEPWELPVNHKHYLPPPPERAGYNLAAAAMSYEQEATTAGNDPLTPEFFLDPDNARTTFEVIREVPNFDMRFLEYFKHGDAACDEFGVFDNPWMYTRGWHQCKDKIPVIAYLFDVAQKFNPKRTFHRPDWLFACA